MPTFCRVDARSAGSTALGILVPPGAATLVILRPRGLEWDLLPARWTGDVGCAPAFCQFTREEAARLAQGLPQSLEESALAAESPIQTFGNGTQFQVWVRHRDLVWIVCKRQSGRPYEPALFATLDEAARMAQHLEPYLLPAAGAGQQYYFNTQGFSRTY